MRVGSINLTVAQLVIVALGLVVMVLVHALIRYTRLGKAMRATAANRNLARNCGIRTDRVVSLTWVITGGLCGLAGAMFAINSGTFSGTSTDVFLVLILARGLSRRSRRALRGDARSAGHRHRYRGQRSRHRVPSDGLLPHHASGLRRGRRDRLPRPQSAVRDRRG